MQAALPVAAPQLAPATPPPVPMSVQGTPAPAATVVATPVMQLPTPAPNPPPSTPTGRDSYVAERLARQAGCSNSDALAQLVAKGAGYESYSMRCTSGDVMMIRCEMGNCRALK